MLVLGPPNQTGYWWQCRSNPQHATKDFTSVCKLPLVQFFYRLASSGWDQTLLTQTCRHCTGEMRITYDFPRADRVRLELVHAVGLSVDDAYIPMVWASLPHGIPQTWFDFSSNTSAELRGVTTPRTA